MTDRQTAGGGFHSYLWPWAAINLELDLEIHLLLSERKVSWRLLAHQLLGNSDRAAGDSCHTTLRSSLPGRRTGSALLLVLLR